MFGSICRSCSNSEALQVMLPPLLRAAETMHSGNSLILCGFASGIRIMDSAAKIIANV